MAGNPSLLVAGVRFQDVGKLYHFDTSDFPHVKSGDYVLVETARGEQLGVMVEFIDPEEIENTNLKSITAIATPRELVMDIQAQERIDDALDRCIELASKNGKYEGVKFILPSYSYDGSLLTIMYTAEENVETDSLRKTLSRELDVDVDLRRIGARDAAKLLGEYGACGSERCCARFLTDFTPVSIKMAKAQGITLNPSEITGMCGRLRCCLTYEYEQYAEAMKTLPRRNKRVGTVHGIGKVIDLNPLKGTATVLVEDKRYQFSGEELMTVDEYNANQPQPPEGNGNTTGK